MTRAIAVAIVLVIGALSPATEQPGGVPGLSGQLARADRGQRDAQGNWVIAGLQRADG